MEEPAAISYPRKGDISKMIPPPAEKNQSLKGFDNDYVDIVDYIVRATHKIWEEGGLGIIYSHYQHDVKIWTSDGLTYGRDVVIANSAQTQSAFPDALLIADDVIWSGNDYGWLPHVASHHLGGPQHRLHRLWPADGAPDRALRHCQLLGAR